MADQSVGIAFQGKDQVSPVVRGIKNTMATFKRDAAAGFGLGAGISVFNLATRALGAVVDVMGDAIRMAMEEEAGIVQLTRSIEENDRAWDGNIDAIEEVISAREDLAFADGEQRESLRQLVAVTKDHEKALDLQRIAMDLARLRGMSLADAGTLIGKVYAGNVGILSRYGIQLAKGTTATEALAEIQRRAAGQAEAYASTTQGKLVRAQIALENAMESLGFALTPVVGQLAEVASDLIPKIVEGVGDLVTEVRRFDPAFDRVVRMGDAFDAIAERMDLSGPVVDKLRDKWIALARESELATGTQEELTAAILAGDQATLMNINSARLWAVHMGRSAAATGDAATEAEKLDAALKSLADGGLDEVATGAKEAAKRIRDLLHGGDERKSVRQLRAELGRLEKQKRQAARRGRVEAFAAISDREAVVKGILKERGTAKAGMQEFRAQQKEKRQKLKELATQASGMPDAEINVTAPGASQVKATLQDILGIYGQLPTSVPTPDITGGRGAGNPSGRRPKKPHSGGHVPAHETAIIRQNEAILTPATGSQIIPMEKMGRGGGRMAVYLDRRRVGWVIDEELGRRYAYAGEAGAYRRAD